MKKILIPILCVLLMGCTDSKEANTTNEVEENNNGFINTLIDSNNDYKKGKWVIEFYDITDGLSPLNRISDLKFKKNVVYTNEFKWLDNGILHYLDVRENREHFIKNPLIVVSENELYCGE